MATTRRRADLAAGTGLFREVAADLAAVGKPITAVDPRVALLESVTYTWQMVRILQQLVSAIPTGDLQELGMDKLDVQLLPKAGGPPSRREAQAAARAAVGLLDRQHRAARARSVIDLYGEWLDRAGKLSAATIRAGVEDRLVRLAEAQSVVVVEALREVLADLPIDEEARTQALVSIAERLRKAAVEAPPLLDDPAAVLARLE